MHLFIGYKRKHNKISLEEAISALELAKAYANDLFSPNISRYNLMVIKLIEFVKRIQINLQASSLSPPKNLEAPVNTAPSSSFHKPSSANSQPLQKSAAESSSTLSSLHPHAPKP